MIAVSIAARALASMAWTGRRSSSAMRMPVATAIASAAGAMGCIRATAGSSVSISRSSAPNGLGPNP